MQGDDYTTEPCEIMEVIEGQDKVKQITISSNKIQLLSS
jgi:hypothetical protein